MRDIQQNILKVIRSGRKFSLQSEPNESSASPMLSIVADPGFSGMFEIESKSIAVLKERLSIITFDS